MVTVYVPLEILLRAVILAVTEVPVVAELGEKLTDKLFDELCALNEIVWFDPLVTAVETVVVVDPPAVTVPDVGDSAIEKSLVVVGALILSE